MKIKAYIQWEITDDNGNDYASSYEHINNLNDVIYWSKKMEDYLNDECASEDEECEDDIFDSPYEKFTSKKVSVSYNHKEFADRKELCLQENGYTKTYQGKTGATWEKLDEKYI